MDKFNPRFLVVSIGNPLPQYATLHSAGHFVLTGLAKALRQPSLTETSLAGQKCLASLGSKYTLVQSPTYMNVSGPFVSKIWKNFVKQHEPANSSLVIVHDELELAMGLVKLVSWERSPRGHNGMKSLKNLISQKGYPESPLARIAVGIDRPIERDAATVSKYVLAPISSENRQVLEGNAPWECAKRLVELETEWKEAVSSG